MSEQQKFESEKVIRLRKPIKLEGDDVSYELLELREPLVEELDRAAVAEGSSYMENAVLIAAVSGWPLAVTKRIGKRDSEAAIEFFSSFAATKSPAPQQEEKTIRLDSPITLKGDTRTYDALELREPTLNELDKSAMADGSVHNRNAVLIAAVSGWPLPVVNKLGKRAYEEAVQFLVGF